MKKEILDTDNIFALLLKISIPNILCGILSALYNIIDSIFVGYFISDQALAALTISNTIQLSLIAFTALCNFGTSTLISRYLGIQQYENVYKVLYTGVIGLSIITFLVSLGILIDLDNILLYIGATTEILPDIKSYITIILLFGFLTPLNGILSSILRARGLAISTMYLALLGTCLNIILNFIFIVVLKYGIFGAGLATVISQFIVLLYSWYSVKQHYKLSIKFLSFDKKIFYQIITLGMPSGIRLGVIVLSSLSANKALQVYGTSTLAAYGIASRIISLIFMIIQGYNFGVQSVIAFNYGAERMDRLKDTLRISILTMFCIGILGTLICMFIPTYFFSLFSKNIEVIQLAQEVLYYYGIFFSLFSCYIIFSSNIQSFGYTKEAIFLALSRPILSIVLFNIFPIFFGMKGIWYVVPIADLINFILSGYIFIIVCRKIKNKLIYKPFIYQDLL